jgi:hypothetical protein
MDQVAPNISDDKSRKKTKNNHKIFHPINIEKRCCLWVNAACILYA